MKKKGSDLAKKYIAEDRRQRITYTYKDISGLKKYDTCTYVDHIDKHPMSLLDYNSAKTIGGG